MSPFHRCGCLKITGSHPNDALPADLDSYCATALYHSIGPHPENGIEGHKSAVHDAQVHAFFSKHYDYWTSRLNIDRSQWDWAFWGENLTLDVPRVSMRQTSCWEIAGYSRARRPTTKIQQ